MSLPAPGPENRDWGRQTPAIDPGVSTQGRHTPGSPPPVTRAAAPRATAPKPRGLPGGRVVTLATLIVIAVALVEAVVAERIALWTDVAIVTVAVVGALVTRPGDRSLPAMMPPLAFLTAVLIAGQALLPDSDGSIWSGEALMIMQTLGDNAAWVVAATVLSTVIALTRHLLDRRRR